MKKFPSIDRIGKESAQTILNEPVDVLEKVDGANFRFTHGKNVDGAPDNELVFGTKNVVYKNRKDIDKNFLHAVEYIEDNCHPSHFANNVESGDDELTIFAEAMHAHTLSYGEPVQREQGAPTWENVPNVIVFDVWSDREGWLGWPSVKAVARRLTLPVVETYHENHRFDSAEQIDIEWESHYRDGVAEGIVLRRAKGGQARRAKYRTDKFVQQHGSAKQGSPEDAENDTIELAQRILRQEPWAMKWIHKYENQGREMEMAVMEDLWRDVFDDIMNEEYETILLGNWNINTKQFRSYIADHVAEQLRGYLNRPDGSVLNEAKQ